MAHQIRKKVPLASKSEAGRNFAAQVLTSLSKADADDDRLFPGKLLAATVRQLSAAVGEVGGTNVLVDLSHSFK